MCGHILNLPGDICGADTCSLLMLLLLLLLLVLLFLQLIAPPSHPPPPPPRVYGDTLILTCCQGKSTQNCRIEYIWRFVKQHVTLPFRNTFFQMYNQNVFDYTDQCDLFYLQVTFLPSVQAALDDFREMWNHHRIRGQRCVSPCLLCRSSFSSFSFLFVVDDLPAFPPVPSFPPFPVFPPVTASPPFECLLSPYSMNTTYTS